MKVRMTTRKRVTVVVAAAMALALGGGVAYAYFTATGTGTGTATVGTSGTWTVAKTGTTGAMTPGGATSAVTFSITNSGSGNQSYATLTPTVVADVAGPTGVVEQDGLPLTGCLASWFTASAAPSAPVAATSILPLGVATDVVTVSMSNPNLNQDVCKAATPDINLAVA